MDPIRVNFHITFCKVTCGHASSFAWLHSFYVLEDIFLELLPQLFVSLSNISMGIHTRFIRKWLSNAVSRKNYGVSSSLFVEISPALIYRVAATLTTTHTIQGVGIFQLPGPYDSRHPQYSKKCLHVPKHE